MDSTQYLVPVYGVYAVVAVGLTVWLARTLFKNGAVFLRDVFDDSPDLADAVNRLLVVGFYLVNLGYASLLLKSREAATVVTAIETLAFKLGLLLLSLGVMHFANMYLFHRIRRRSTEERAAQSAYRIHAEAHPPYAQRDELTEAALRDSSAHSAFELLDAQRNAT